MQDKIVKFEPKHFDEMTMRKFDTIMFDKEKLIYSARLYPTYTVMLHNKPAAVFGVLPISEKSSEMWSITGTQVDKYPISYHKIAKVVIPKIIKDYGLVRLQVICLKIHKASKKWLEALGFEEEGILRKYDSENDYYMMAKVI